MVFAVFEFTNFVSLTYQSLFLARAEEAVHFEPKTGVVFGWDDDLLRLSIGCHLDDVDAARRRMV